MIFSEWKQKRIVRRRRRTKKRLSRKPSFIRMFLLRFAILTGILLIIMGYYFIYAKKLLSPMGYFSYPEKYLREYDKQDECLPGGSEFFDVDYLDSESQWEVSAGHAASQMVLNMCSSKDLNGYWCLYDFTNNRILAEPEPDIFYAVLQYSKPDGGESLGRRCIWVNKSQSSLLRQYSPIDEETGVSSYHLDIPGIDILSGYVLNNDFIIRTYRDSTGEHTCDLSGLNTEGYRLLEFTYTDEEGNPLRKGECNDGQYDIQFSSIYDAGGFLQESVRKESLDFLNSYIKNPDMKARKSEGGVKIFHSGIGDFLTNRYRIVNIHEKDGQRYGIFFVFDQGHSTYAIFKLLGIYFLYGELIIAAIILVITAIVFYSRKYKYEVYTYRTSLTTEMAEALKAPLEEISENARKMQSDSSKDGSYTAEIAERVADMNNLITDLLALSRNDDKKIREVSQFSLSEILSESFLTEAAGENHTVKISGDVRLKADRTLFENAVRYIIQSLSDLSEDGCVNVDTVKKNIQFSCAASEDNILNLGDLSVILASDGKECSDNRLKLSVAKSTCEAHGFRFKIMTSEQKLIVKVTV